jgi:hypothetical protein
MIKLAAQKFDGTIVTADKLWIARVPACHATHEIREGNGRTVEIDRGVLRRAV